MIIRHFETVTLMDMEALVVRLRRRSPATIRKHCTPVASDVATRRHLYEEAEVVARMAEVPERRTSRRQGQLQTAPL